MILAAREHENEQLSDNDIFSLTQMLKDEEASRRVHFIAFLIPPSFDRPISH